MLMHYNDMFKSAVVNILIHSKICPFFHRTSYKQVEEAIVVTKIVLFATKPGYQFYTRVPL